MASVTPARYSDVQRMELRGTIRLASEVIAQYWPMRTFVHHNPLHSLEYLKFEETVKRGRQLVGGNGYLPGELYRGYVKSGRIGRAHLDEALKPLASDKRVMVGTRAVSHAEVLRACLTHGLCAPTEEPLDALLTEPSVEDLASRLTGVLIPPTLHERASQRVREDQAALGHTLTLSHWCDLVLKTDIVEQVNGELIKWCEAFLDEGHATWPMPGRDADFYRAWKSLMQYEWSPCGIANSERAIAGLPEDPEDAVLDSLAMLAIPEALWQNYLSLQMAALPGWAGFIKWRAEERDYIWQKAHPAGLVKFLAIRLWYVCELVQRACRSSLGIDGNYRAVLDYMHDRPREYFLRRERLAGRLPATYAEEIDRWCRNVASGEAWDALAERYQKEFGPRLAVAFRRAGARRLLGLAAALDLNPSALSGAASVDLAAILHWMDAFPESDHGPVWLKAFEAGYHESLMAKLTDNLHHKGSSASTRPATQSVFCIDVRSEPFRRHLETVGANETYGFAGFFAVFIRYRAWGKEHDTEQYPVIMRAKNEVREIPRSYRDYAASGHESRAKLVHAGHTLLHDLKENVVTPYVMVESLGWLYSLPIVGKTILPTWYAHAVAWLKKRFVPALSTCMTVDKLPSAEIEQTVAEEQRVRIGKALHERLGLHGARIEPAFVEALWQRAMNGDGEAKPTLIKMAGQAGLPASKLEAFIDVLRREYRVDQRGAFAQKEHATRTGFTLDEQALTVDTALRMMGLTKDFARLVLFCAHGSTSENNPFEAALDCGACGGNEGHPNARVLAAMANNSRVRERLAKTGLVIPADTHFLAGQVDTTTDETKLFDLEDLPSTHTADIERLKVQLQEAGRRTSLERCARLPDAPAALTPEQAAAHTRQRSVDWSQVRPEWGLSGNAAFIIGRRTLTRGLDLEGRVFLHSYDYREDPTDKLLEVLMTAPQVVAQWINMEHYFSVTDNDIYGAGSKVYHNVVGRFGIMSGPWSDLRLGLAWQTMMNGEHPYHEPMRLTTVIEAPCARIEKLIARHEVLKNFYHHEWVHLLALDPEGRVFYRYLPTGEWSRVAGSVGQ